MKEVPRKIGYCHFEKSSGATVKRALQHKFNLEYFHVEKVGKEADESKKFEIQKGSIKHKLVPNILFMSGHIGFYEMKVLNRDFIFTNLRQPKERIFSFLLIM